MPVPVVIVSSGGLPVVLDAARGVPMTPVTQTGKLSGMPVTIVNETGKLSGMPVSLVNDDLTNAVPRELRLMGISTRLHLPLAVSASVISGREVMYSNLHFGYPAFAGCTDFRAFYPWFYLDENAGGSAPETDVPNGGTNYGTVSVGANFFAGSFDGASSGTMAAGSAGRWATFGDLAYTPGNTGKLRTANVVAIGAVRPVGYSRMSGVSSPEASEWSDTLTLSKIQTGGSITNNTTGYFYGPCLLVARGNDGRPVALIVGNSIDFSNDENTSLADSRGNIGFWQRGFDDSGERWPYINFASPGSRFGQTSSLSAGEFRRRAEILRSLSTGVPADFACGGDENSAANDAAQWRAIHEDAADFINDTFGMPFAFRTLLPKVTYGGNHLGDDLANQTPAVDKRVDTNTLLIASPADYPTFQLAEVVHDAGTPTKWKVPAFTTTVAATYNGSGAISLAASPPIGITLVFGAGTAGVAMRTVTSVSGSGPYNVTCSAAPPSQTNGAAVGAAMTADSDGFHPSTYADRDLMAPVVVTGKANI